MLDELLSSAIEKVPEVGALALIVYWFLKFLKHRDEIYLTQQREVNKELEQLTTIIKGIADKIEHNTRDVCNFHDEFANSLNRIEKKVDDQ